MNCLDAETLAAWVDGGLSGAALEDVQSHVANCARCQALVGAMGRTRAAVPATQPERAPSWWLAWAVPLTAAATAVAIWIAVPRHADVSAPSLPERAEQKQEATAPATTPPPVASAPVEPGPAAATPHLKARTPAVRQPARAAREATADAIRAAPSTLSETASAPAAAPVEAAP